MLTDTLVFLSTGAEAERNDIPSVVSLRTWHQRLRRLLEEPPSRWRWPPEKPPRRLEVEGTTHCQNPL
jgi:hypothetical protein